MHNLSPADEMRLDGTFRNEHSFRDFGILSPSSAARTSRSRSRSGRASKHGASLVPARLRLLHVQIVDELPLAGWIELWQPSHTSVMRRMMSSGASVLRQNPRRLDGPLHGPARTQGRQYQHMRRLRKCAVVVASMPSMPGMAISINTTSG